MFITKKCSNCGWFCKPEEQEDANTCPYYKSGEYMEIDDISKNMDLSFYDGLRYMNNREREACQTVPHGYTSSLTKNEAACILGDGWTVDVIAHIFKGLK